MEQLPRFYPWEHIHLAFLELDLKFECFEYSFIYDCRGHNPSIWILRKSNCDCFLPIPSIALNIKGVATDHAHYTMLHDTPQDLMTEIAG